MVISRKTRLIRPRIRGEHAIRSQQFRRAAAVRPRIRGEHNDTPVAVPAGVQFGPVHSRVYGDDNEDSHIMAIPTFNVTLREVVFEPCFQTLKFDTPAKSEETLWFDVHRK